MEGRVFEGAQEPGLSGHMRPRGTRIFSISLTEHRREGRATSCPGRGESSNGGDENLQGCGNEATGSLDQPLPLYPGRLKADEAK